MPRSNVPIRICGSKTRNGCRTCKQRHVKCDETHPTCLRCQKANRVCVYDLLTSDPLTRQPLSSPGPMSSQAALMTAAHRFHLKTPSPERNLSPHGLRGPAEVNAIQHFACIISRELAGCFDDHVWSHIFPRVAHYEPAIWHGIVAVSTLDTSMRLDREASDRAVAKARKHHDQAISQLLTRLSSQDSSRAKDVVLLACILFAIYECLSDNSMKALQHISSGMKVLKEWACEVQVSQHASTGAYLNYASLQPILFALDSQAVQMGVVSLRDDLSTPAINDFLTVPSTFNTIEEAHLWLTHLFNRISRWSIWVEPVTGTGTPPSAEWIKSEETTLNSQLSAWNSAFKILHQLLYPQPAILLLLIQRNAIQAFFNRTSAGPGEIEWDNSLHLFQEIVDYAELYFQTTHHTSPSPSTDLKRSKPCFTTAMDIVLPLFLTSVKCRDTTIRRRACMMLKNCGRKEGVWDSKSAAEMAEYVIETEERERGGAGIPEEVRIYALDVHVHEEGEGDGEGKAEVISRRNAAGIGHSEEVAEKVTWNKS